MTLAAFDFRVKHRAGKSHGNADGLSRAHQPVDDVEPFHVDALEDLLHCPDPLDPDYLLTSLRCEEATEEQPAPTIAQVGP